MDVKNMLRLQTMLYNVHVFVSFRPFFTVYDYPTAEAEPVIWLDGGDHGTIQIESENNTLTSRHSDETPQYIAEDVTFYDPYGPSYDSDGRPVVTLKKGLEVYVTYARDFTFHKDGGEAFTDPNGEPYHYRIAMLTDPWGPNSDRPPYQHIYTIEPLNGAPMPDFPPENPPKIGWFRTVMASPSEQTSIAPYEYPMQPAMAACFAKGTLIDTPDGAVAVEELAVGDLVLTRDKGPVAVKWIGCSTHAQPGTRLAPVRIARGALGQGPLGQAMPAQDLILSPQHRVCLSSRMARRRFGTGEVLVAAKTLLGMDGVTREHPKEVSYYHIAVEDHALIGAHGVWAESFYPGPMALAALSPAARAEFTTLFPEFAKSPPQPARPILNGGQARDLIRRHHVKRRALCEAL